MAAVKRPTEEVILEELFVKDKALVGVQNLAKMLGTDSHSIVTALKLDDKVEELDPSNKAVKKWMKIFNLILEMIKQADSEITKDAASLRLKKWLHVPQIQLGNETPLDFMLKGKTRQLTSYLEQLVL
ncbi:MAG: hypothetical protein COW00_14030 [Bdellovibrio sp. CG12_big_fil_rev_8_21_14_0_65_39_13]|nr:MAG: hypothetical protein COW78_08225 [Bdellovibrio sp. CG22_combo_CG10-13_8_21_14_all_39_27]PIQ58731.1 MAG: hypothetical protein COW00_14030 [Bdellovibrio sp. CG12_big_fil_rev_8_21_14_0_65_39_13]PIR35588.1 MAG: hypothetical protein COV37_08930 [Bdellovibrio sp. CG11_big_fil_rev_8_21_14_0_20_39_38]